MLSYLSVNNDVLSGVVQTLQKLLFYLHACAGIPKQSWILNSDLFFENAEPVSSYEVITSCEIVSVRF